MVRIYTEDVRHLADNYAARIDVAEIKKRLKNLLTLVGTSQPHIDYVNLLKTELDNDLLTAGPSKIELLCKQFSAFKASLSTKFGTQQQQFYKLVIDALGYDTARSYYRDVVPLMGIKTCVYCNAQYAVSFSRRDGIEYAQFEVDHWKPESRYPFLGISFYNFVPSCPSCNKHKTKKDLKFCIYSEVPYALDGVNHNPFVFLLSDDSLTRFLNSYNKDLLKLEFKSRVGDSALEEDYARFAINEMYECFRDEAAMAIRRYLFYSDAYREQLQVNYGKMFSGSLFYEEFIYGVSFGRKDVLRRPLAKMIQDIRAQLETSSAYFDWLKSKGYV